MAVLGPDVSAQGVCASGSPAFAQNYCQPFSPQGPAPTFGPTDAIASRDAAPDNGSTSGAVQAVLPIAGDPSSILAGSTNGGIWVTHNGGATWTPLTSNQPSLSIASLAYNSSDSSILYAGIGWTSSGHAGGYSGGVRSGVMESTDGGRTWTTLSLGGVTGSGLLDKTVIGVAGSGTGATGTILAATAEPLDTAQGSAAGYGLYRSVGGGAFVRLNPAPGSPSGLPPGAATALVGQGTPAEPYYVAISAETNSGATKTSTILRSVNAGATWTTVLTGGVGQIGRLAIAPNGAVAAMFTSGTTLAGLSLSQNGTSWTNLNVAQVPLNPADHFALGIDPNNTNVVYVAGDTTKVAPYTTDAYRVTLQNGTTVAQTLTDSGTADNSTAHADSRAFAIGANGNLLMANDGGLYLRSAPLSNTGIWTGLNGSPGASSGLQVLEGYAVAYDAVSKRLLAGAQDEGVISQQTPQSGTFVPLLSADGINAEVNDRTYRAAGQSIQYYSTQGLSGLTRAVVDAQGNRTIQFLFPGGGPDSTHPGWNFVPSDFTVAGATASDPKTLPFSSRIVLNRRDPTLIAIGTNFAYVTTDALVASGDPAALTNVGTAAAQVGEVTALAYGTNDAANPNALLAGSFGDSTGNKLFYSPTAGAGTLNAVLGYAGEAPRSIVFDPSNAGRYYIADGTRLWSFSSGTFSELTPGLAALNISRPTSLEFISSNGVNALLAGGLGVNPATLALAQSPIAVANVSAAGTLGAWSPFGQGLAGTALPTTTVNVLSYNSAVDVLTASLFGRGFWTLYDVTSYFSTASVLRYGLADNDSTPDASFLTGARPLEKDGAGTLTIGGTAAYTGASTVNAGTMVVNGSIASSSGLTVNTGATVRGTGTLPMTTVNGTLWPGNTGTGSITVNDRLTFGAGGTYMVDASTQGTSQVHVARVAGTGAANLDGTVQINLQPGAYGTGSTFSILTAAGGVQGAFAAVSHSADLPFLRTTLSYDANEVFLTVAPGGFATGGATANQVAVGAALDRSIAGSSGAFLNVLNALSTMSQSQAPAVLDAISGQPYANLATLNVATAATYLTAVGTAVGYTHGRAGGGQRVAVATDTRVACDLACESTPAPARYGAWLSGLGGLGSVPADGNASATTYNYGGSSIGLDYRVDPNFLIGFSAGYIHGTQWVSGFSGQATTDTVSGSLYASFTRDSFYLDGVAGYANATNRMTRTIILPGMLPLTAQAGASADQILGQLETGYTLALDRPGGTAITPFARLQASTSFQGGFTESGANVLDLAVSPMVTNSLRTTFGADFIAEIAKVNFDFRLGWLHEFADVGRPMTASFAAVPGNAFTVFGAAPQRDSAAIGLAARTRIADATEIYARYDGEVGGGFDNHGFTAGLRMTW